MCPKDDRSGDSSKENLFPEEFEDDLDDDWESAFQTDDFTFSPDGDAEDFFTPDNEGAGDDDHGSPPDDGLQEETAPPTPEAEEEKKRRLADLSVRQKICLSVIPLLLLAAATPFFFSTEDTPPSPQKQTAAERETVKPNPDAEDNREATKPSPDSGETSGKTDADIDKSEEKEANEIFRTTGDKDPSFNSLPDKKIRKRYDLPQILITAGKDQPLLAAVNATLVLQLPPDQALTTRERLRANDVIYRYFKTRSGKELENLALDRGRMIQGIREWVEENWADSPFNSVIINNYRVDKS